MGRKHDAQIEENIWLRQENLRTHLTSFSALSMNLFQFIKLIAYQA